MFAEFAVLGISLPELLFIVAVGTLLFATRAYRGLPGGLTGFGREVRDELNGYHEDKQKQTGHAEANDR
ncbi:MAG TPA: hypothetical protein VK978_04835 [Candidatus Saccharimonadales bacterium]|nr:hypothetical protein [Candidatus Saccharimonadales bacterium]